LLISALRAADEAITGTAIGLVAIGKVTRCGRVVGAVDFERVESARALPAGAAAAVIVAAMAAALLIWRT
jgi:hypothetical protein